MTSAELAVHAVPTFADVLATLGREAFIDVELKEWVPAIIDLLDDARAGNVDRIAISSFHDDVLRNVGSGRPRMAALAEHRRPRRQRDQSGEPAGLLGHRCSLEVDQSKNCRTCP